MPVIGVHTETGKRLYPEKEFKTLDEAVITSYNDNKFQEQGLIFYENGFPYRVQYITSRGIVLKGIFKNIVREIQII